MAMWSDTKKLLAEILPWTDFLEVHKKKDPVLFPETLFYEYNIPYEIIYYAGQYRNKTKSESNFVFKNSTNGTITKLFGKNNFSTPPLFSISTLKNWIIFINPFIKWIFCNRKKISHYMFFHKNNNTFFLMVIAHLFNKNAKIYLKLDATQRVAHDIVHLVSEYSSIKTKIRCFLYRYVFSIADFISVETEACYSILKKDEYLKNLPIHHIPNGITNFPNICNAKENCMITVARFGTEQKNTELLLDVLSAINFHQWKFYFIGSIENAFSEKIKIFFKDNPDKRKNVFFVGNISDSSELTSYYEKSKVFILPSRYESFGIATLEAAMYGNYLILSDTGAARDFIKKESFGHIIDSSIENLQSNDIMKKDLISHLQNIIDGKIDVEADKKERYNYFIENYSMKNIIKNKNLREFCE